MLRPLPWPERPRARPRDVFERPPSACPHLACSPSRKQVGCRQVVSTLRRLPLASQGIEDRRDARQKRNHGLLEPREAIVGWPPGRPRKQTPTVMRRQPRLHRRNRIERPGRDVGNLHQCRNGRWPDRRQHLDQGLPVHDTWSPSRRAVSKCSRMAGMAGSPILASARSAGVQSP